MTDQEPRRGRRSLSADEAHKSGLAKALTNYNPKVQRKLKVYIGELAAAKKQAKTDSEWKQRQFVIQKLFSNEARFEQMKNTLYCGFKGLQTENKPIHITNSRKGKKLRRYNTFPVRTDSSGHLPRVPTCSPRLLNCETKITTNDVIGLSVTGNNLPSSYSRKSDVSLAVAPPPNKPRLTFIKKCLQPTEDSGAQSSNVPNNTNISEIKQKWCDPPVKHTFKQTELKEVTPRLALRLNEQSTNDGTTLMSVDPGKNSSQFKTRKNTKQPFKQVNMMASPSSKSGSIFARITVSLPTELMKKAENQRQEMRSTMGYDGRNKKLLSMEKTFTSRKAESDKRFLGLIGDLTPQYPMRQHYLKRNGSWNSC